MSFQVRVEPSGRSFTANPDETLLDAAIRQGVPLPYGCKDGGCGSCRCIKLSGDVAVLPGREFARIALMESESGAGAGALLLCSHQARSDVVLESRQVGALNMPSVRKLPSRVFKKEILGQQDVLRLFLQLPASEKLLHFPGQYVDLLLPGGVRRSYSIANLEDLPELEGFHGIELHIRRMSGGSVSPMLFEKLQERDIVRLEGPYGSFYLREESSPKIFLASGTGFAPIKAMLLQLRNTHKNSSSTSVNAAANTNIPTQNLPPLAPVTIYWGGNRPEDLYLLDWLENFCAATPGFPVRFVPVISNPPTSWTGRKGLVHRAVMEDFPDLSAHQVYACGAPVMVDAARKDFEQLCALPAEQFFSDAFVAAAAPKPPAAITPKPALKI